MAFASEPKNLVALCDEILPFPPGMLLGGRRIHPLRATPAHVDQFVHGGRDDRLPPTCTIS